MLAGAHSFGRALYQGATSVAPKSSVDQLKYALNVSTSKVSPINIAANPIKRAKLIHHVAGASPTLDSSFPCV